MKKAGLPGDQAVKKMPRTAGHFHIGLLIENQSF
jgi:hypothetical protein